MRVFVFILLSLCALAVPAMGQTVTNYADCSALDSATVSPGASTGGTITNTIVVEKLADTDLINIEIRVTGSTGQIDVQIDVETDPIFSGSFSSGETSTVSFDPDGDQSSTSIVFTSEFIPDPGSGSIEVFVDYFIACTPNSGTTSGTTPTTPPVVTAFLAERAHRLLEESPDRPRAVRKRLDALWGSSSESTVSAYGTGEKSRFWMSQTGGGAHLSLRSLTSVNAVDFPIGSEPVPEPPPAPLRFGCWDLWAEGHYVDFQDAGDRNGDFAVGYLGVDCQVHPAVIAGVLGQVDWMDDRIGSVDSDTDGVGWMIGPYATARLTPNLFLDVRAAWGQSDNDVNVGGVTASFDTTRWLVSSQLTGNLRFGDVRVSPEISIAYIEERQDSYVDSSGANVAAQTVSLGRLRFGPEISRRFVLDSGVFLEPHFAIRGLWDFDGTDVTIAGIDYGIEGFRGIAEIGLIVQRPDDFNIRFSAKYDGIALSDYYAFGGNIWINIPLN